MLGVEIQIESRENARERFLEKMAKKRIPLEVTGHIGQADYTQKFATVIISRRKDLVIRGDLIGGMPIPLPSKKEIDLIPLS